MKKQFALLLCAAIILSCVSCGTAEPDDKKPPAESGNPATADTIETDAPETEEVNPLPQRDFNDATVNILTAAEQWQHFYNAEDSADVVDSAVYKRNLAVMEDYGVSLNYVIYNGYSGGVDAVRTALHGSVAGGTKDYDLMVGSVSYVTPRIGDHYFSDLNEFEEIDLSQPWWYQYINEQLDLNGRLYVGAGSLGMTTVANSVVAFFNHELADKHNLNSLYGKNLYKLAEDGEFTYDKFVQMSEIVTNDTNSDGVYNSADTMGFITTYDYFAFIVNAFEYFYTTPQDDGAVQLTGFTERLAAISEKIQATLNSNYYLDASKDEAMIGNVYNAMINNFATGKNLFMLHQLQHSTKDEMRNMEGYGFLPLPKFDDAQKNYYTPVVPEVAAIPLLVNDAELSGTMMEALQYYTYKLVRPEYFEIALKRKMSRDEESAKMLDLIMKGAVSDFAYNYLSVVGDDLMYGIIRTSDYASFAAGNFGRYQGNIDAFVDVVNNFE